MPTCPQCHREVPAEWKFCRFCGQSLAPTTLSSDEPVGGLLTPDLLAHRIRPGDMQGLLAKSLVIEEGQAALLLIGGRHDRTLGPGKHSIGNILGSRARNTSVVLVKSADVSLDITVSNPLTSDPLSLTMDIRLSVKVEKPPLLWQNLVGGADSYSTQHLAAALYPLVEEGCRRFVGSRSIRQLKSQQEVRSGLQLELASHLDQPAGRWGLRLTALHGVTVRCETRDKISRRRTEFFVTASQEATALEGRKRLFDVHQEADIQALAQETAAVAGIEKRLALWERTRQAVLADTRESVRSQAELEEFVRQVDSDRLLQEAEHQALARTVAEAGEDHDKARAFFLRRVEAEHDHELDKLELGHRFGLEQERLTLELATSRQQMEARWELESRRLELQIARDRRLAEAKREQETEDRESARRTEITDARSAATADAIAREQDAEDVRMALDMYGQYKKVKRDDLVAQESARLKAEERKLTISLEAEERRVEMRLKESRQEHEQELARIEALSSVGIETLIAVSGPEQAQLLTQLARTRSLAGCSPEQILAMQAEESPQVADALKEILTATAASGQLEQYERLVGELKDSAQASREDHQRNLKTMTEMFNKALDTVRDTAVAFSGQAATRE